MCCNTYGTNREVLSDAGSLRRQSVAQPQESASRGPSACDTVYPLQSEHHGAEEKDDLVGDVPLLPVESGGVVSSLSPTVEHRDRLEHAQGKVWRCRAQ